MLPPPPRISIVPQVTLFTDNRTKSGVFTGLKYTYVKGILDDKVERVYTLFEIDKTTKDLKNILEEGRLVVLKIKDGRLQGILLLPNSGVDSSPIKKFMLVDVKDAWTADKVAEVALLPDKLPTGKLKEEQYIKIGTKLLNNQNRYAGLAPEKYVVRKPLEEKN